MNRSEPEWLSAAREACRRAGIEISGWGDDTLLVNARTSERAKEIAALLRPTGLEPVEDDAASGLLLLSRNPPATRAKERGGGRDTDISRRPLIDRVTPAIEGALFIWLIWYGLQQPAPKSWLFVALGAVLLMIAISEGRRILGWRLEVTSDALRVRLDFRWRDLPWKDITGVELTEYPTRRSQEGVTLTLTSNGALRLGAFNYRFARALRDGLRREIASRRGM